MKDISTQAVAMAQWENRGLLICGLPVQNHWAVIGFFLKVNFDDIVSTLTKYLGRQSRLVSVLYIKAFMRRSSCCFPRLRPPDLLMSNDLIRYSRGPERSQLIQGRDLQRLNFGPANGEFRRPNMSVLTSIRRVTVPNFKKVRIILRPKFTNINFRPPTIYINRLTRKKPETLDLV